MTGRTDSADFPISTTLQSRFGGGSCNETACPDGFVAKLDTTVALLALPDVGTLTQTLTAPLTVTLPGGLVGLAPVRPSIVWSTYLGGSGADEGTALARDPAGNVYVTGDTASSDFPTTTGAYSTTLGGGTCSSGPCPDAFVAKIDATGALSYSTLLGGSGADEGAAIAVDSSGHAYVTGQTTSPDFPTLGSLQAFNGTHTIAGTGVYTTSLAFVARLNKQGSALFYSSYLGGSGGDAGTGIAVDGIGDVLLTGQTGSGDLLTLHPQAGQAQPHGNQDAFVTGLDATLRHLTYGYDGLGRLTGVTETLGNAYAYAYDAAGNRTDEWVNGVHAQQLAYNAAEEVQALTQTAPSGSLRVVPFTYDAAGNLTGDGSGTTYRYDALDRLSALSSTVAGQSQSQRTTYRYNGDGVLLGQSSGDSVLSSGGKATVASCS